MIVFQFNAKSSGQNVPEAKSIAKKCEGIIENNFYKIEFETPEDANLEKLINLVGGLKGSRILINKGEGVSSRNFLNTIHCQDKLFCKGICTHVKIGKTTIDEFILRYERNIENGELITTEIDLLKELSDFLEETSEDRFKLSNILFSEHFQKQTDIEKRLCQRYDEKKIRTTIEKFPNKIKFIDVKKYSTWNYDLKFDIKNFITTVLDNYCSR